MRPITILVDETPRCVVRPVDRKDLFRFTRNARSYLVAGNAEGAGARIEHREAEAGELARWQEGLALHLAWGGEEEGYFGVPL